MNKHNELRDKLMIIGMQDKNQNRIYNLNIQLFPKTTLFSHK